MTKLVIVDGLAVSPDLMQPAKLTVRFTHDARGETLSIADDRNGYMFSVAFEDVQPLIDWVRQTEAKKK